MKPHEYVPTTPYNGCAVCGVGPGAFIHNSHNVREHSMKKAVVVLSGGQDSTTCLFWAFAQGYEVHTVTFDYGQRHHAELRAARAIVDFVNKLPLREHVHTWELITLPNVLKGASPLISNNPLEQYVDAQSLPGGLEKTFVPMRNQLFLTIAANRAYVLGTNILVTGVSAEDYGGYPDCRREFISSFETTCHLGAFTGREGAPEDLLVETPLMYKTKAETVLMALEFPMCYEALAYSHTAYDGEYPPVGHDHASLLRAKGFKEAGVPDPLVVRAALEHRMVLPDTPNYDTQNALVADCKWRIQLLVNNAV